MVIAVSGKGGMGKTTLAALIVRHLVGSDSGPVLAVDADPNSNLDSKLGLNYDCTIGDVRENTQKRKHTATSGTPKQRGIEYEVQQAVTEGSGFDLVVMGRGEGPGCYCAVNNMLRAFLQDVVSGYTHVVIDNEAGMEHLSRRTNDKVDLMLIVSDTTPTGLSSARRISEMANGLDVIRGRMGLVINRVNNIEPNETQAREATGLDLLACVPSDPMVEDFELRYEPLLHLPGDSLAVMAIGNFLQRIM